MRSVNVPNLSIEDYENFRRVLKDLAPVLGHESRVARAVFRAGLQSLAPAPVMAEPAPPAPKPETDNTDDTSGED